MIGFKAQQGLGILLFTTATRLGSIQLPIQWIPVALSLGVNQLRHEAGHSHPSSAEVKNAWCLVKAQGLYGCLFHTARRGQWIEFEF
jgi:hypothetical protein